MRLHLLALTLGLLACTGKPVGPGSDSGGTDDGDDGSTGGPDDSGENRPPCFRQDPELEVGTGADSFQPLSDGDPVVMVHGPQGGWHMLGSVRVRYTTDVVNIRFVITTMEDVVVADNNLTVLLVQEEGDDCAGYYPGMYAYLSVDALAEGDLDTPPELLSYETLRMKATVTDQEDRVVSASVDVTATPDPMDVGGEG